jgi:signal transduction histidine kinase
LSGGKHARVQLTQAVIQLKAAPASGVAGDSLKRVVAYAVRVAVLGGAYYLAARLGLAFRFQNSQISVVWPANAVLLAALLLTSRSRWWAVFVTTALAHVAAMASATPAWRLVWQIVGNSVFMSAAALLLRRYAGLPLRFDSRRQVFTYAAISVGVPAVFALMMPAFVRPLLGFDVVDSLGAALLRIILSNVIALLLVAPVLLLWGHGHLRRLGELTARRAGEGVAIMASLLVVGLVAFGTGPEFSRFPGLLLWFFPPLVWAAVRLGPRGAATSVFFVALLSTLGTARELGPFVLASEVEQVLSLQLFWIAIGPPIMLLAAIIREREQAEEALHEQRKQLAHVTRVATAGELSGAIAHELRQPLTSILANAQAALHLLARDQVDLKEVREILQDITRDDQQAANVLARLRSFMKDGTSRFEPLAVDAVVRDALALSKSTVELSDVDVQTSVASGLPRVFGDPVQLLQVMVNLVVNGCESMHRTPQPARRLDLCIAPLGQAHVEVLVTDHGIGLPNGAADRVFDPFFTTKADGLGLGLAIGRSIVTAHGGHLWAENNTPQGATFHLVLPTYHANGRHAPADRHH